MNLSYYFNWNSENTIFCFLDNSDEDTKYDTDEVLDDLGYGIELYSGEEDNRSIDNDYDSWINQI